jgi:hypothetical protein
LKIIIAKERPTTRALNARRAALKAIIQAGISERYRGECDVYVVVAPNYSTATLKRLYVAMGRPPIDPEKLFIDFDSLPVEKADYKKLMPSLRYWGGRSFQKLNEEVMNTCIRRKGNIYYVLLNGSSLDQGFHDVPFEDMHAMRVLTNDLTDGAILTRRDIIIGVPRGQAKLRAALPEEWKPFFSTVAPLVAEAAKQQESTINYLLRNRIFDMAFSGVAKVIALVDAASIKHGDGAFAKCRNMLTGIPMINTWDASRAAQLLGVECDKSQLPSDKEIKDIKTAIADVTKIYPLFLAICRAHASSYESRNVNIAAVAEYINLVDAERASSNGEPFVGWANPS